MKICIYNFFNDIDLNPFILLFNNVFNETIEYGNIENSDILFESIFGNNTLLYNKKWKYSFFFIGESDRRLPLFLQNGMNNKRLNDYSCILKGKSENDFGNIINFPLYLFYSYAYDFTDKFINENKKTNIPKKNVCVIISNGGDQEGRNLFIEELNKMVHIDYAGQYKNNVGRIKDPCCSPGFIDFVSQYKIIITMENSKNDNYITEKILEGFAANNVPVYWGADNIGDYFNKERFINVKSFSDMNESIDKIMQILNNDKLYLEIINRPIYVNNRVPLKITDIASDIKKKLNIHKKHFITFGNISYHNSVKRICEEAKTLDFFDHIKDFTEEDLQKDSYFWNKHGQFILDNKRGYGYWIWKSYLIKKSLDQMKDNDILIYCDAGCEINNNGKQRLYEYIDMLNTSNYGLISFQLEFKEIQYTKQLIFDKIDVNKNVLHNSASVIIIKKNIHSINIIEKWFNYCENYHLINDHIMNESNEFIENRHDQSILSVLVNKYGSIKLMDETYFVNWSNGLNYPFWTKRIK
jgi:hypothetical protein